MARRPVRAAHARASRTDDRADDNQQVGRRGGQQGDALEAGHWDRPIVVIAGPRADPRYRGPMSRLPAILALALLATACSPVSTASPTPVSYPGWPPNA